MATIKDVAKQAGVSTATVSRIINGKGEASPETVKRVKDTIEQLGYRPNSVAKMLSNKKSNLIALLIPNLRNPYFSQLVEAIESAANEAGYQLYLCNTEDKREKVEYYLEKVRDNYVEGVIIDSLFVTETDLLQLEKDQIITITIDRTNTVHELPSVRVNHELGGYLATEHLIKDGHCKQVVFMGGPKSQDSSEERKRGFLRAVSEQAVTNVAELEGNFSAAQAFEVMTAYLEEHQLNFDGIFCANDAMALGVMRALQDAKIKIPQDVKLIGYDNLTLDEFSNPRLSSVDQHPKETASLIMQELKSSLQSQIIGKYSIKPSLVVRESSQD